MDSPLLIPAAATVAGGCKPDMGKQPVNSASHEQLMLAYAAGDASAFDRLYEQYRAPLYRFILRQVKDPVASNDLYQQCWEKLIKGRHTYRSASPFPAWLFRIARNTVIDYFRRQTPDTYSDPAEWASETAGPETLALQTETELSLAAAVHALPADQREVVLLRLEAGLDLSAIAQITGSNPETCKSRLRYALAKLHQQMQQAHESSGGHHAATKN